MGSELSKRYDVDKDATGSGGHGYQWKSYQATRKKDGLEAWLALVNASERGLTRKDAISAIGEQATDELKEGVTKWIRKNQA